MPWRPLIVACGPILSLILLGNAARADACKSILDELKKSAANANRAISSTATDLDRAIRQLPDEKKRLGMIAQFCAASAEAFGILKSYRVVVSECMTEREGDRKDALDTLDRAISQVRVSVDKACQ